VTDATDATDAVLPNCSNHELHDRNGAAGEF
jgi:hypothetical protein